MSGWGWGFMVLGSVLFWALLITAIVLVVRRARRGNFWGSDGQRPEELLAQRFARGEIDEAEYRQRLAVLADRRHTTARAPDDGR